MKRMLLVAFALPCNAADFLHAYLLSVQPSRIVSVQMLCPVKIFLPFTCMKKLAHPGIASFPAIVMMKRH